MKLVKCKILSTSVLLIKNWFYTLLQNLSKTYICDSELICNGLNYIDLWLQSYSSWTLSYTEKKSGPKMANHRIWLYPVILRSPPLGFEGSGMESIYSIVVINQCNLECYILYQIGAPKHIVSLEQTHHKPKGIFCWWSP